MDAPGPETGCFNVFPLFHPLWQWNILFSFLLRAFAFRPTRNVCAIKRRKSRERGGFFSRRGEPDAPFLPRIWSIWGNLLCDFTTKHLKKGDQSSSWGNDTCRAQNQAWGWALTVAAPNIYPERCAGGSGWRSPSCLCTGTLASADQTNRLFCHLKIFPLFPILYNQICFDMYQCTRIPAAKLWASQEK